MSVNAALIFPVSTESPAEQGQLRVQQPARQPVPGSDPPGEIGDPKSGLSHSDLAQDEVKVQIEPPEEIAVYKFLDQSGTLVLQVPPQQLLDLAQAIYQELAQEAAPKPASGTDGGKNHGH
jgi:hypothetical protein